jgi:hypothetical protein
MVSLLATMPGSSGGTGWLGAASPARWSSSPDWRSSVRCSSSSRRSSALLTRDAACCNSASSGPKTLLSVSWSFERP